MSIDAETKSTVQKMPMLTVKAGPRDGEEWAERLKEELGCLIKFVEINKANDRDFCEISCNDTGTRWEGKAWFVYKLLRYEFDLQFEVRHRAAAVLRQQHKLAAAHTSAPSALLGPPRQSCSTSTDALAPTAVLSDPHHISGYLSRNRAARAGREDAEDVSWRHDLLGRPFQAALGTQRA